MTIGLLGPAATILLVSAILLPSPTLRSSAGFWRRKLWDFHVGWLGLGLAFVLAWLFTQGSKNLFGKPRPDLLARCQPDLSDVAAHVVGGFGQSLSERWVLVSSSICRQTDRSVLDEGFRSFPSGHASMSWQGMVYLSLWLCSKFGVRVPGVPGMSEARSGERDEEARLPTTRQDVDEMEEGGSLSRSLQYGNGSTMFDAAPPVIHLIVIIIPICVAIYVSSTRYVEFKHHGVDILSGALIGIGSAWLGFRWYHASLSSGRGFAWGARARSHAFFASMGEKRWTGRTGMAHGTGKRNVSVGRSDEGMGHGNGVSDKDR